MNETASQALFRRREKETTNDKTTQVRLENAVQHTIQQAHIIQLSNNET